MRCFFNLVSSTELLVDDEGVAVKDLDAAGQEALKVVSELREEDAQTTSDWRGWRLEITDEAGALLRIIDLGIDPPTIVTPQIAVAGRQRSIAD